MMKGRPAGERAAAADVFESVWKRQGATEDGRQSGARAIGLLTSLNTKNAYIRADGRMIHDMYLMQVKTPAESKEPWDYFKLVQTIPGHRGSDGFRLPMPRRWRGFAATEWTVVPQKSEA